MRRLAFLIFLPLLAIFFLLLLGPIPVRSAPSPLAGLQPADGLACSPWKQVNAGAFGLPSVFDSDGAPVPDPPDQLPYRNEEGFEVTVFNGQLYLGMEADNHLGARIWRTRAGVSDPQGQDDWEEVIAGANGRPWGIDSLAQADHIDSLAVFDGRIYASTANRGDPEGTRVFRSATGDPGDWEDALQIQGPGFGNPANENFKDMIVYGDWLCGGTWNGKGGAEVWCSQDGLNWEQKNAGGWGDDRTVVIWSSSVFDGGLYFGAQHYGDDRESIVDDTAVLYRTFSLDGQPAWEQVYQGGLLSIQAQLLGAYQDRLYLSTTGPYGIEIFSSPDGSAGSWESANIPGMAGSLGSNSTVTDGAAVYGDALYVAVTNTLAGMRVWRSIGNGYWEIVGAPQEYAPARFAAQLAVYNGSLYAWASDWQNGQAVMQTACRPGAGRPGAGSLTAVLLLLIGVVMVFSRVGGRKQAGK